MKKHKNMPDIDSSALFVKVIEYGSFSEASKRAGVPVSTISRRITLLESRLGVRLIERSTRKLRLTELGRVYFDHCRRALEEFELASSALKDKQEEVSGLLRVSIPPSLERCFFVPLVASFLARYPNARVRIWVTEQKLDLISDHVDIALRVGDTQNENVIARPLLSYRHILVATPGYLESMACPCHPSDLKGHRLICFTYWFDDTTWTFRKDAVSERYKVEEAFSMNDFAGIQAAVESGFGIGELPSFMCNGAIKSGDLVEVLPDWKFSPLSTAQVSLSLVYPSNRHLPKLVRLFKEFCVENVGRILYGDSDETGHAAEP